MDHHTQPKSVEKAIAKTNQNEYFGGELLYFLVSFLIFSSAINNRIINLFFAVAVVFTLPVIPDNLSVNVKSN